MNKVLITIVGPTAVGKTALAIKLAKHYKTEIISADSRQFYREMNIGTAKPSIHELNEVKHHLVNNISVSENYNISNFEKDAKKSINLVFQKSDFAILVGGSGLYIDTILYGIDKIPFVDHSIRKKLNKEFELNGTKNLINELKKLDPVSVKKIDLKNHRRIIRALEVCISSKKPYSTFLKSNKKFSKYNEIIIGLNKNRPMLYNDINERVDEMIRNGLLDEVKKLIKYKSSNALNTIGYKELFDYLEKNISLEFAIEKIKINSRRYAKRQLTWFKSKNNINWFLENYKTEEVTTLINNFSTQQLI